MYSHHPQQPDQRLLMMRHSVTEMMMVPMNATPTNRLSGLTICAQQQTQTASQLIRFN